LWAIAKEEEKASHGGKGEERTQGAEAAGGGTLIVD